MLAFVHPEQVEVEIWRADELEVRRGLSSELDEMWSFVQAKAHPRWLWHAIDHHTGKVLAYVFGRRKDAVFLKLQQLLEPFGITKFYTDGWGAYERHIDARAASRRQGEHAENREQAHQSPDPDQAARASEGVSQMSISCAMTLVLGHVYHTVPIPVTHHPLPQVSHPDGRRLCHSVACS